MKRRTGGVPGGPESAKPFVDVQRRRAARECDASSRDQWREDGHLEAVRVADRTDAETAVRWRQTEPRLNSGRRRKHVPVAEGDQLRLSGGARSLQNKCDCGGIGLLSRRRGADVRCAQIHAELAGAFAVGLDDGKATAHSHVTRGRRPISGHDDRARPKSRQPPVDLRRGQLRIDWHGHSRTCGRDNRQSRVGAARKRNSDSGAAIEAGFT